MLFKKKKNFGVPAYDFMLVGLGNPGERYRHTRHNCGFMALELWCSNHNCEMKKLKFKSHIGECTFAGKRILLQKPDTFMNNSGIAVKQAMDFYKLSPEQIIIIFDDISLPPGKLRIRRKGSDGGHNGIKSIISHIGGDSFPRIKVGVGIKPSPEWDLADWVLSDFRTEEKEAMPQSLKLAVQAAECIIEKGTDAAMNLYNNCK